jgi:hypothetical protein
MRRGFGLFGLLITAILLVIVGVIAYNVGWSDGVNTHLPAGTSAPAPYYYGYGPHFFGGGFAIFGIFWFLLILFGLFWLFRLAFWGFAGRRMMGGGWGHGRGMGYGPGSFEERAQEWHRRAHGEQPPATGSGSGSTPPPPPPDTRSI